MRILIYAVFFALLMPVVCLAQDLKPFSTRVSVSVTAGQELKGKIEKCISKELSSHGDIIVTTDDPRWILDIIAAETTTKGGHKVSMDLSIVIMAPFDNKFVLKQVDAKYKEWVSTVTSDLYTYSGHWLRVGPPENLGSMCRGIVSDFDRQFIKPARDSWQKIIESPEENKTQATRPDKAN